MLIALTVIVAFVIETNERPAIPTMKPPISLSRHLKEFCGTRPSIDLGFTPRIVGGKKVEIRQIPWQVSLFKTHATRNGSDILTCGGALITERSVLTASHCLKLSSDRYKVIAGRTSSHAGIDQCNMQIFDVAEYVKHPNFNSKTLKNDIALLFISSKYGQGARWTDYVMPICLPSPNHPSIYEPGTEATVSGWGMLEEEASYMSSHLQQVSVPIISLRKCKDSYENLTVIGDSQFCAGIVEGGKDACSGDSGGPLTVLETKKHIIAGVVSFGMGCGRAEYPGVYSKVDFYVPWIMKVLDQSEDNTAKIINTQLQPSTSTRKPSTTTKEPLTTTSSTTTTKTSSVPPSLKKSIGPVCKGYYKYAVCPSGSSIRVISALFGRERRSLKCGGKKLSFRYRRRRCSVYNAKRDLAKVCDGKRFCKVSAGVSASKIFSGLSKSRCRKIKPYVTMDFECIVKTELGMNNIQRSSEDEEDLIKEALEGSD